MKQHHMLYSAILGVLFIFSSAFTDTTGIQGVKMKQSGFIGLELGQIVTGNQGYNFGEISDITRGTWERLLLQYVNDIGVGERVHVNLALECQLSYSYPYGLWASVEMKQPRFSFYPDRAEGTYTIGDPQKVRFEFGFGYFPYKTNPDVKNLGEYMFRTGTYPLYILNNFNRPYSRLLGLRTSLTVLNDLKIDALITCATLVPPLANGSLSVIADYNFLHFADIGMGVSFANCFPVDDRLTTPKIPGNQYTTKGGDTAYYTFKGVKPMAKLSLDPKVFIPGDLFNKQDLRLYGEVCVSGWENYKNYSVSDTDIAQYYADRKNRTVFMLGCNFPSFFKLTNKALNVMNVDLPFMNQLDFDVLSFEYEYMPNKYPNSTYNLTGQTAQFLPLPSITSFRSIEMPYPWYWSIYAKKTILNNFAIVMQFARDHMRPINNDPVKQYYEDVLERKGDWWWCIRLNVKY
jgi:hypothetical protein